MYDFARMNVLDAWYARLDESDYLAMLPHSRQVAHRKWISKATARSSSELVFPKLADLASGTPRIRDTQPTISHLPAESRTDYSAMCLDVLAQYRSTLAED